MGKLLVSYAILFIAISPTRVAEATGVSVHDNASQGILPTQRLYACNKFSKSPLMANTNECKGGTLKIPDAVACAKAAEACGYRFRGAKPLPRGSYEKPTGCMVSLGATRRPSASLGDPVYFNTAGSGGPSIYTAPLCLSACSTLASDWCLYRSDCRWTGSSCSDATCSSNRDCANGQSCDDGRCRSPAPSSKREAYAEMKYNTNVCTSGTSRILDPATCTAAAEALGYRWLSTARRGRGCYVQQGKPWYVYFGTNSVGTSSARFAPLCLASPTEAPPKEAPPTEAPPTEAPPTEAPPTEAPPTEAPPTDLLPYTGMTCETNDGYGRWRRSKACTAEVLNSDVTTWADGSGVHFSSWAKIALASPVVLSSVEVFHIRGQTCDYDVQYSIDGTVWATVCSVTAATSGTDACASDLPSAAVSYLRIHKPSQRKCSRRDAWFRLTGVKIFGASPTEALTFAPTTTVAPTEAPTATTVAATVPPTISPTEAPTTTVAPEAPTTIPTTTKAPPATSRRRRRRGRKGPARRRRGRKGPARRRRRSKKGAVSSKQ